MTYPNSSLRILYKFPSRTRPEKFAACVQNIVDRSANVNYHILATIDEDDPKAFQYGEIITQLNQYCGNRITTALGRSNNKIHAVNRDMDKAPEWDILIVMSDDMVFEKQGHDEIIRQDMLTHFPDLDGVLHYDDGNQGENVMTMSIMGRKYFERFGYIYHPDYVSLWCDAEATEVARLLGKIKYMGDGNLLFRHMHPSFGLAPMDEQYRKTEASAVEQADKKTYETRKGKTFDLPDPNVKPKLAILIPTIEGREESFERLMAKIEAQAKQLPAPADVMTIHCKDNQTRSIGSKRNELVAAAIAHNCTHIAFLDDDDDISDNYIELQMPGVYGGYDCCSLVGKYYHNGEYDRPFLHSIKYPNWETTDAAYLRPPNHLNVIRLACIGNIRFPENSFGEDKSFSEQLAAAGTLKREYEITEPFYFYYHVDKDAGYKEKIKAQKTNV